MKILIPFLIGLLVMGCGKKDDTNIGAVKPDLPLPKVTPVKLIEDPDIELAIRFSLKKPIGTLTEYDLRKVTELDLSNNKMTELPMGLGKLTKLELLVLNTNRLTEVPDVLEKITSLVTLDLTGSLTDTKGLEKLRQVKRLLIGGNELTEVPDGVEKLTQLKYLSLWNNQLSDLIGLEKLIALEELNIEYNPDLTKALIDELQKALPNCEIIHNAE